MSSKLSQAQIVARIKQAKAKSRGKPKRKPRSEKDGPLEHDIQTRAINLIKTLLKPDIHIYAIPNGGYRRPSEAIRLKAEGVKAGIGDLIFLAPNRVVGFLEMKTKRGSLTDEQEGFMAICIRHGHLWGMARTVDEAVAVVRSWGMLR
jgi:hypothetical protein